MEQRTFSQNILRKFFFLRNFLWKKEKGPVFKKDLKKILSTNRTKITKIASYFRGKNENIVVTQVKATLGKAWNLLSIWNWRCIERVSWQVSMNWPMRVQSCLKAFSGKPDLSISLSEYVSLTPTLSHWNTETGECISSSLQKNALSKQNAAASNA